MDFYILVFPRDTQYIVLGALLYVFLHLFLVSCIPCYRKKKSWTCFQNDIILAMMARIKEDLLVSLSTT